jgi:hypothetical protein
LTHAAEAPVAVASELANSRRKIPKTLKNFLEYTAAFLKMPGNPGTTYLEKSKLKEWGSAQA